MARGSPRRNPPCHGISVFVDRVILIGLDRQKKTMLMDMFYNTCNSTLQKTRTDPAQMQWDSVFKSRHV